MLMHMSNKSTNIKTDIKSTVWDIAHYVSWARISTVLGASTVCVRVRLLFCFLYVQQCKVQRCEWGGVWVRWSVSEVECEWGGVWVRWSVCEVSQQSHHWSYRSETAEPITVSQENSVLMKGDVSAGSHIVVWMVQSAVGWFLAFNHNDYRNNNNDNNS